MPDDEGLREELAAALLSADYESIDMGLWRDLVGPEQRDQYDAYFDVLLPVVERYAARRAAEALWAAAEYWDRPTVRTVAADLRDRADALDGDGTEPRPAHRRMEDATGYADWLERHDSRFRRQGDADGEP